MKLVDSIFGPGMEGKKTEYVALGSAIVVVIVTLADQLLGITLSEGVTDIMSSAVVLVLALTLGARANRTNEKIDEVLMNQPKEEPATVLVTVEPTQPVPGAPSTAKIASS